MHILELLRAERDKVAQQVNALDTAIRALSGSSNTRVSHGPRKMSAAARARISASQKARWARTRGKVVSIAPNAAIAYAIAGQDSKAQALAQGMASDHPEHIGIQLFSSFVQAFIALNHAKPGRAL